MKRLARAWLGVGERWQLRPQPSLAAIDEGALPVLVTGTDASDRTRWNMVGGRYDRPGLQALELLASDVALWVREASLRKLNPAFGGPEVWLGVGRGFRTTLEVVTLGGASFARRNLDGSEARFGRIAGLAPPARTALVGYAAPPIGLEWRRRFPAPILLRPGDCATLAHVGSLTDLTFIWEAAA